MAKRQGIKPEPLPFQTDSLLIAAALKASGCEPTATPRTATRWNFTFADGDRARELAAKYMTDSLLVSAQRLFVAFEDLRTIVKRGRENAQ